MRIQTVTNQPIFFKNTEKEEPQTSQEGTHSESLKQVKQPVHKLKTAPAATIVAVAAVCSFFMLSRGFQKNTNRFLNRVKNYLEERSARTSKESSKSKKIYNFFINRTNSFIRKSESINNITSLKDILFMKLMYKTKPTQKIHESISNFFEKISKKTVLDAYDKTEKNFANMNKIFDELDEYIIKNAGDEKIKIGETELTKKEWIEQAKYLRDIANLAISGILNKKTIQYRADYIKEVTSSLYSTFWDASFKDFWSKNNKFKHKEMWQSFIAAEQVKGDKSKLSEWVSIGRNAVTYTKRDEKNNVYEYVKALSGIIPDNDTKGAEIIKKLEPFAKNPELLEQNKETFFKVLKNFEEHDSIITSDKKTSEALNEYKDVIINAIRRKVNDTDPGAFQQMLSIYYKIAPFELEKSDAMPALRRAVKSFDHSFYLESVEFFDKLRDLKLGSAPTDVLTILLSFITLTYGFGHAKDKDKRTSIMLKSGIPIVGGIATATYSAAKLVSGGKSLALGFLSGIALNQLGVIADNMRKNMTLKQAVIAKAEQNTQKTQKIIEDTLPDLEI